MSLSIEDLTPEEIQLIKTKREQESEKIKLDREQEELMQKVAHELEAGLSAASVRWYASNVIVRKPIVTLDFTFGGKFKGEIYLHVDGTYDAEVQQNHMWRPGVSKTPSTSPTEAFRKALRNSMKKEEWEGIKVLADWVLSVEDKPIKE